MTLVRGQLAATPGFSNDLDIYTGLPGSEEQLPGPANQAAQFLDFGLSVASVRIKTIAVVVDSPLTSAAAGQATIQLFAARSIFATAGSTPQPGVAGTFATGAFTGGSGGASQFPATGLNATQARGAAVNFGPNTNSIAAGIYFFSPVDIPELQWYYPVVGVEIKAAVAFTGGSARVFLELANV